MYKLTLNLKRKNKETSEIEAKKKVTMDAWDSYSIAAEHYGRPALNAFYTFTLRLNGKPPEGMTSLSIEEAKLELDDRIKFTKSLTDAYIAEKEREDALVADKTNTDIIEIKKQTAIKAVAGLGIFFVLIGPGVSRVQDPILNWAEKKTISTFNKAKELCKRAIRCDKAQPPRAPQIPKARRGRNATPQKKELS